MSIWHYANPANFMALTRRVVGPLWVLAGSMMVGGLLWSLSVPPDYQQGSTVTIMFIHVPAALLAINTYFLMAIASAIGLIRGHHVSYLIAKAAAPIGAAFTAVALVTGAVWGEPMWGTWWVWDARLTAVLIMFFFYLGYIALWAAIDDPDKAAELTSVLCLVGVVFSLLSRYAVFFWATLHQGSSLSLAEGQRVADAYRDPLYFMMVAFYVLFAALLLTRARMEIRRRRARALRARAGRAAEALEAASPA